jgi:hypothetical protein
MTDGVLLDPDSPRWQDALARAAHDVYQRPGYVRFDAAYAGGTPVAYCYESGPHVFLLPLVLRGIPGTDRLDATSPYGYPAPVSDTTDPAFWAAAAAGLPRALRAVGAVSCFVRMHPLLASCAPALGSVGALEYHGDTVSIDLRGSEEDGWRGVRENHRRQIKRAWRAGRTVVFDDWSYLDAYLALYHQSMRRVGAEDYYFFPASYFSVLRELDAVHLAVALDGDSPIAGAVCFETGGIVQYHLGGTRTDRLGEQPSKLVIYEVSRWARARGNRAFHLGSGVGGRDNPLFHFKAGFSPLRHPFHTWRIVADAPRYRELTLRHCGRQPDATGFFPAYRAPVPAPAGPPLRSV